MKVLAAVVALVAYVYYKIGRLDIDPCWSDGDYVTGRYEPQRRRDGW